MTDASCLVPCRTCPWRLSSTVGGSDIPGFSIDKMRLLSDTVGPGDEFRKIMACHCSEEGEERPCIGYVAVEGWSNLSVRIMALRGRINVPAIEDACKDIPMWSSFNEMLAAYERCPNDTDGDGDCAYCARLPGGCFR